MSDLRLYAFTSAAIIEMSDAELEVLFMQIRALNRENGITGVLLYDRGTFMQCIEGSPRAIEQARVRIHLSGRHRHIIDLIDEPASERCFPSWDIGVARVTASELLLLGRARWRLQAHAPHASPHGPDGLELLRLFWDNACGLRRAAG